MQAIRPPPEFLPERSGKHTKFSRTTGGTVGFWDDKGSKKKNAYMPVISKKVWPDKDKFLEAVWNIENYIHQWVMNVNAQGSKYFTVNYRGLAESRLEDVNVGASEFHDTEANVVWPQGYAPYYIGKKNVMPTKLFYEYIMYRIKNPFPGMKWSQPIRPTYPACPPSKIYNHDTRRCVSKTGKIGKIVAKEQAEIAQMSPIWPAWVLKYGINYAELAKKYK